MFCDFVTIELKYIRIHQTFHNLLKTDNVIYLIFVFPNDICVDNNTFSGFVGTVNELSFLLIL